MAWVGWPNCQRWPHKVGCHPHNATHRVPQHDCFFQGKGEGERQKNWTGSRQRIQRLCCCLSARDVVVRIGLEPIWHQLCLVSADFVFLQRMTIPYASTQFRHLTIVQSNKLNFNNYHQLERITLTAIFYRGSINHPTTQQLRTSIQWHKLCHHRIKRWYLHKRQF